MLTLDQDELARLRTELFDLIVKHAGQLVPADGDERAWLTALLGVDAAVRRAMPKVTKTIEDRSLRAGMSQAAIGRARGTSRQSVNGRVKRT